MRSSTGHVGIRNLGCTCYMNSLMQQLYCMPALRRGLLAAPHLDKESLSTQGKADNLLYQLQRMFCHLSDSAREAYEPAGWCYAYKDEQGRPTNSGVQQDAQEYFNVLCDRIEAKLKGGPMELLLQQSFAGKMSQQLLGLGGELIPPAFSLAVAHTPCSLIGWQAR